MERLVIKALWNIDYRPYNFFEIVLTIQNHDRYQERLNGLSPMEYRAKAA